MKKLFGFLLVVAIGVAIWVAFALWTGIYSVYTYPPGNEYPEGATFLISREEGEPTFNSPEWKPPKPEEKVAGEGQGGIKFESPIRQKKKPVQTRIIVELPYIEWAYKRSLGP